jgi:hypothetical protein
MKCILFWLFLYPAILYSQELKTIQASSEMVAIREDKKLRKNAWKISPDVSPDVFQTNSKKVTFYTDKDEITVYPEDGKPFEFIIDLNGKKALTRVEYTLTYLQELQKDAGYDYNDSRALPSFAYTATTDQNLKTLRTTLKLDSVAGNGSEVSRIINLMRFVHNSIRHNGSADNPAQQNALGIIEACKITKKGVNCRMMATVLNECYLAMGFKSRFITCMPKELKYDDCHVINMVYSESRGKWLWMDPTFEAYVMDKKGNLLSVEEVRERLVSNKPLKLNKDANWNHEEKCTKEHYLDNYMAKNLYRIQAPAVSLYNTETASSHPTLEYVQLVPVKGLNQTHKAEMVTDSGDKRIFYVTNNPDVFWAKP